MKQPVTEAVFLYENKNTQDLKEFVISSKSKEAEGLMTEILNDYKSLNDYIAMVKYHLVLQVKRQMIVAVGAIIELLVGIKGVMTYAKI